MDRLTHLFSRFAGRALLLAAALLTALTFAPPATAAPCMTNCLTPGDYNIVTSHAGQWRSYRVHVPASYRNSTSTALLLDIHGFTSYDQWQKDNSGQLEQSNKRGFIAVWPQGLDFSWNGYVCCWTSYDRNVDDVGFLRRVVTEVKARANIDADRVFATGLSNGALMSHRLACEAADIFRAVSPVSFTRNAPNTDPRYAKRVFQCRPSRPITVYEFHGTNDDQVTYGGGAPNYFEAAPDSLISWKTTLGCSGAAAQRPIQPGVTLAIYESCTGGVRTALVTVDGGLHNLYPKNSAVNKLDVAEYIWTNVFR